MEDMYLFTLNCQQYVPKYVANFVDMKCGFVKIIIERSDTL